MVMLGADTHKRTHTFVALDDLGRRLAVKTVAATSAGNLEAVRWAWQWSERTWALEDCRSLSRRLERELLLAGERVVRVPPKLMAGARQSARERGKSDPIDAEAVGRAALREDLPVAQLEGPERELRLLVDHRENLVGERTRHQCQLRWLVHELDPGNEPAAGALDRFKVLDAVAERLDGDSSTQARIAVDLVARIRALTIEVNKLEREIGELVAPLAPTLLAMCGCGVLTAAKIVGEAAGISRFPTASKFARHNGTAPIPVWSGSQRYRLNRGGNRQLNAALHRIAITQIRAHQPSQDYIARQLAAGKTKTEAIRLLRRRLSDEVYRRLRADEAARERQDQPERAAA